MNDEIASDRVVRSVAGTRRRLVLEARALTGRWYVTSHLRRDRPAWPPAPDTAFSALVAAAAAMGDACDPALRWLETLELCGVEAECAPGCGAALVYVPVPDRTLWHKAPRQPIQLCSTGSDDPVRWSWTLPDEAPDDLVLRLSEIAAGITHIGATRGPVLAHVFVTEDPLPASALVPVAGGRTGLRSPFPGRLDELEAAWQQGRRAPPAPEHASARLSEVIRCPQTGRNRLRRHLGAPWGPMMALKKVSGPRLDLSATVPLCAALRRSLLAHLHDDAPEFLTGHDARNAPAASQHLAFVPLARIGDVHADGEVRGLGLVVPRGLDDADHAALVAALAGWLGAGSTLVIGQLRWRLAMAIPGSDHTRLPVSLRAHRYECAAAVWSSVTPVAFDAHPKRREDGRFKPGRSIFELVAGMCGATGLPNPAAAELLPTPAHVGAEPWTEHAFDGRDYLARAFVAHLRVRWRHPVPGPILLGRGRHFGLGLMLPDPRDDALAETSA